MPVAGCETTDIAYAFVTHKAPSGKINEDESSDIRAFTAEELAAIPSGEVPEDVREIGLFIMWDCLNKWIEVNTSEFS